MKTQLFRYYINLFLILITFSGCKQRNDISEIVEVNPAAPEFNFEQSDSVAITIADKVMEAMGGRQNWDKTHYICWNFLGMRELIWDKFTGDVRIESLRDGTKYIVNIHTMNGKVLKDDVEIANPDSLKYYLDRAKRIWINDSYWLVMPFKLKDSGVTLTYLREDTTQSGLLSDVLQLQFNEVGVTPENRYEIWIEKETSLVRQWAYFQYDSLKEPGFTRPFDDWKPYGDILLSGNRGDRSLDNIMVLKELPEHTFSSFDPVILSGVE